MVDVIVEVLRPFVKFLIGTMFVFVVVSLVLPCGPCNGHFIEPGSATRCVREIRSAELAISKLLADAGERDFRSLFDHDPFRDAVAIVGSEQGLDAFEASIEVYTISAYVLLKRGNSAEGYFDIFPCVLQPEVVQRLDEHYLPELGNDRWGELYQFYPGPWPEEMGVIVFRRYRSRANADGGGRADRLTIHGTELTDLSFGWPAPSDKAVYIWSYGENGISGQGRYDPAHEYALPAQQHYAQEQEPELMGGGDDINNWDANMSFLWFYE